MNKVILLGRLVKEPELKTQGNTKYTKVLLAVKRDKEHTDFISLTAFNKRAELITTYVRKGDMISIEGSLSTNKYEKDGNTVFTTDIIVNHIYFTGPSSTTSIKEKISEDELPF